MEFMEMFSLVLRNVEREIAPRPKMPIVLIYFRNFLKLWAEVQALNINNKRLLEKFP